MGETKVIGVDFKKIVKGINFTKKVCLFIKNNQNIDICVTIACYKDTIVV